MNAVDTNVVDACIYLNGRKLIHRAIVAREKSSAADCYSVTLSYRSADFCGAPKSQPDVSTDDHTPLIVGYADGGAKQPLAAAFDSKRLTQTTAETLWVGDMDSLNKVPEGARTVTLERQKSVSDGAALMDIVAERLSKSPLEKVAVVEIVGATGGRRDHEWANLSEIHHVFRALPRVVIIVQPSIIVFGPSTQVIIDCYPKGLPLSCFTFDPEHQLAMEGLEYSGKFCMQRPSTGLSNVSLGNRITIKSEAANPMELPVGWSYLVLGHDEECYFLAEHH
jgi:thiamine pyrophosphokinase